MANTEVKLNASDFTTSVNTLRTKTTNISDATIKEHLSTTNLTPYTSVQQVIIKVNEQLHVYKQLMLQDIDKLVRVGEEITNLDIELQSQIKVDYVQNLSGSYPAATRQESTHEVYAVKK
jgi:type VII secretion effector (TIGR04197 family)